MRRKYFWKLPLTRAPVVNWSTTVNFALSYLPSVPSCWQFRRCWHSLGRMFTNWQLMRDIGHVLQLFGELWCFRETLSSSEHTFDVHLHCFVSSSDWLDAFDVTCTASFRRRIDLTRLTSSALLRFVVGLTWRVWHSSSLLYSDCIIRILLQAVLWVVQCSVTDCLCLCLFVCLWVCLSVCGCVWMTANVQVTTRWGITTGPTSFKWHNSVNMRFVYMKISGNIDDRMVSLHIWK